MDPATGKVQEVTILRRCNYPQCTEGSLPEWRNLKRCAACACAWYCSKKCQKAAWPVHKHACRFVNKQADAHHSVEHEGKLFGFDSLAAISQAIHDYIEAHKWAILNATSMHILVKSGPGMDVVRQMPPQEIFKIRLMCQTTPGAGPRSSRNPASMFKIVEHGFVPIAHYPANSAQLCIDMLQREVNFDANLRSTVSPAAANPFYVGVIPVMYVIDGLTTQLASTIPVYRPLNKANIDDRATKATLENIIRFFMYSTGTGFPLRIPNHDLPSYAVPGRLTRTKEKRWNWEALFTDWKDYFEGRTDCERLPGLEELGWRDAPLPTLMDLYAEFWMTETDTTEKFEIPSQLDV